VGHVSAFHSSPMTCVIRQLVHNSANQHLPRVVRPCHVSYGSATCHTVYHVSIRMDCMDCTVNTFFLHVCRFEQNVISLSSDVRLNPNELRWVRDDEAYAPVRFEAILSTLNFEKNLIPWITLTLRNSSKLGGSVSSGGIPHNYWIIMKWKDRIRKEERRRALNP
jgi:hypothetical protein